MRSTPESPTWAIYMRYVTVFMFVCSNFSWSSEAPGVTEMLPHSLERKVGAAPTRLRVMCRDRNSQPSRKPFTPNDAVETKHEVA